MFPGIACVTVNLEHTNNLYSSELWWEVSGRGLDRDNCHGQRQLNGIESLYTLGGLANLLGTFHNKYV